MKKVDDGTKDPEGFFESPETLKEVIETTQHDFGGKNVDFPVAYLFGAVQFLAVTIGHLQAELAAMKSTPPAGEEKKK